MEQGHCYDFDANTNSRIRSTKMRAWVVRSLQRQEAQTKILQNAVRGSTLVSDCQQ